MIRAQSTEDNDLSKKKLPWVSRDIREGKQLAKKLSVSTKEEISTEIENFIHAKIGEAVIFTVPLNITGAR